MTSEFFGILVKPNLSSIFLVLIHFSICLLIIFNIIIVICKVVIVLSFNWCLNLVFCHIFAVFGLRVAEETVLFSIVRNTSRSCLVFIRWHISFYLLLTVIHNAAVLIREISWLPWAILILSFLTIGLRIRNIKLLLFHLGLLSLMLTLPLFLSLLISIRCLCSLFIHFHLLISNNYILVKYSILKKK